MIDATEQEPVEDGEDIYECGHQTEDDEIGYCPFAEEIHGDSRRCRCCPSCWRACCDDI